MQQKILFLFLLIFSVSWSQNTKVLKGKVVADSKDLLGITIRNLSLKREAMSSEEGFFSITAKPGDTLLFTAVQLKSRRIVIEKEDFDYLPFMVKMELAVTQLKEVVIQQSVSAESLGIVPKGMKTYTPVERRLYTAGDFKPIHLLKILGGSMPFDPVLNKINGKTARLKKEIMIERSELLQQKISNMFEDEYFNYELKIPNEYIVGFKVFASEDNGIANAINDKNRTLTVFLLSKMATEYLKRISDEK